MCAHDYLCHKGRPRYTCHFPCASEQSASAQCKRHVHIEPYTRHMSENLWKRARGFGTSFSVHSRTIIGQRTLTKLINRRAFRSPCALQHSTTTSLLTPPRCNRRYSAQIQWHQRQRNKLLLRRRRSEHDIYVYIHGYSIAVCVLTGQQMLRQASLILSKIRKLPHWLASEFQTQIMDNGGKVYV